MAQTVRPRNGTKRPTGQPDRSDTETLPDKRIDDMLADAGDGVVVDLELRRLSRPWPGWWGAVGELPTWTWAERSRRCCA